MTSMLCLSPVIMAGGVGSRLWPLSRKAYPKQFQSLVGRTETCQSLLQQTMQRLQGLNLVQGQIICHEDHRFLTAEHVRGVDPSIFGNDLPEIILEPCSRSTAPAVLIAALRMRDHGNNNPMVLLSADHAIDDCAGFHRNLAQAAVLAEQGYLVTLGIRPTFASTGYGYIKAGNHLAGGYKVDQFVEKPDKDTAQKYVDSESFFWNSGMFIATPQTLINEASRHCPALLLQCELAIRTMSTDMDFVRMDTATYAQCENISIDYAIMESTNRAAVVLAEFGWSDVGDYQSLTVANTADREGNVNVGDVVSVNTQNCYIHASSKLVTTLGISNLAVVETKDAVLVANLDDAQAMKTLVAKIAGRAEIESHREVFRPWGSYDNIADGENYQVKRITVRSGQRLSLQKHQYRAEHWVVVSGRASVHLDGQDMVLEANDSIYIPQGAVHSLANQSDDELYLIEVQSGSYLGEDDIERLDDLYGRSSDD